MNKLLLFNLLLLLVAAIFDPSDTLFHAKVPLFIGVWIIVLVDLLLSGRERYPVPAKLMLYLFCFSILIPLVGLLVYILRGGGMEGYEGFKYLKSYLFLSLCVPLAIKRIDLMRPLSSLLTGLSLVTISVAFLASYDDGLRKELALFGGATNTFTITTRTYANLSYDCIYFYGSPLIVMAVVYFSYRSLHSFGWARRWSVFLLVLNICGLVVSGTRNNLVVAIFAPLLVLAWYRPRKSRVVILAISVFIVAVGLASGVIQAMLSSDDYGNAVKLGHLHDYSVLFSDWKTLLFGQGLGASFFSTAFGTQATLTEVSYLEIFRNYGLLFAPFLYALIFYPLRVLLDRRSRSVHYLFLGYACYLFICISDPLLLSSTGMLVLAAVLYKTFCTSSGVLWRVNLAPA